LAGRRFELRPGEKVLIDIAPHWSFLTGPLTVAILAIAAGIALDVGLPHTSATLHWIEGLVVAVPCAWLGVRFVRWRMTRLVVTSERIVERRGVLSRRHRSTPFADIDAVFVDQSLPRRMIGTGRIELEMRGGGRVREIDDVRKPVVLRRVILRRLTPYPPTYPSPGPAAT
jgi:uncharacterized membrane protein YdbT with pleckstrin-like domain